MKVLNKISDIFALIPIIIFYVIVPIIIGLVGWAVLKHAFTTGDIVVLLFIVVFFMSLKYN